MIVPARTPIACARCQFPGAEALADAARLASRRARALAEKKPEVAKEHKREAKRLLGLYRVATGVFVAGK